MKKIINLGALLLSVNSLLFTSVSQSASQPLRLLPPDSPRGMIHTYKVAWNIDGDTLAVKNINGGGVLTIRLMGVDTPETKDRRKPVECYGPEASNYTKQQAPRNALIGVRFVLNRYNGQPIRDKYRRNLAYLYVNDKKVMLQELLLKNGFAREYSYHNYYYPEQEHFRDLEDTAYDNHIGLWGVCKNPFVE